MNISRRGALKVAALGAAAATGVRKAEARERPSPPPGAKGVLYDSTLCIGCKACTVACREANGLSLERHSTLHDDAYDLTGHTASIIKLYQDGESTAFVKQQCMHCVDPACVTACMLGSLQKREGGAVTWIPDRCIGCRYCQIACPFDAPSSSGTPHFRASSSARCVWPRLAGQNRVRRRKAGSPPAAKSARGAA